MTPTEIRELCKVEAARQSLLQAAMKQLYLSARAFHRILKLALTIADLESSDTIKAHHVAEAVQYHRDGRRSKRWINTWSKIKPTGTKITPVHVRSSFYDVDGFKSGRGTMLMPCEPEEMGDVRGKSLLHLQCHFGMDTLAWARSGAKVTGVDFSDEAIKAARKLGKEMGIKARFIESDIYTLPDVLKGKFDIVYTGAGAICWLPDLAKWAKIIHTF